MTRFRILFHTIQIKNDKEDVYKLKNVAIGKIPSNLIFESVENNIPKFKKSFIELVRVLDHHENNSINGKYLTAILKKEFGALDIKK